MTAALVIVPGICYLCASALYASQKNWPLAITYAGYSVANVGLLWLDIALKR